MYTKDFLIGAYLSRFEILGLDAVESLYKIASNFYDATTRDNFRKYCSLDAQAVQDYKNKLAEG
jgi:hypothetical protein